MRLRIITNHIFDNSQSEAERVLLTRVLTNLVKRGLSDLSYAVDKNNRVVIYANQFSSDDLKVPGNLSDESEKTNYVLAEINKLFFTRQPCQAQSYAVGPLARMEFEYPLDALLMMFIRDISDEIYKEEAHKQTYLPYVNLMLNKIVYLQREADMPIHLREMRLTVLANHAIALLDSVTHKTSPFILSFSDLTLPPLLNNINKDRGVLTDTERLNTKLSLIFVPKDKDLKKDKLVEDLKHIARKVMHFLNVELPTVFDNIYDGISLLKSDDTITLATLSLNALSSYSQAELNWAIASAMYITDANEKYKLTHLQQDSALPGSGIKTLAAMDPKSPAITMITKRFVELRDQARRQGSTGAAEPVDVGHTSVEYVH